MSLLRAQFDAETESFLTNLTFQIEEQSYGQFISANSGSITAGNSIFHINLLTVNADFNKYEEVFQQAAYLYSHINGLMLPKCAINLSDGSVSIKLASSSSSLTNHGSNLIHLLAFLSNSLVFANPIQLHEIVGETTEFSTNIGRYLGTHHAQFEKWLNQQLTCNSSIFPRCFAVRSMELSNISIYLPNNRILVHFDPFLDILSNDRVCIVQNPISRLVENSFSEFQIPLYPSNDSHFSTTSLSPTHQRIKNYGSLAHSNLFSSEFKGPTGAASVDDLDSREARGLSHISELAWVKQSNGGLTDARLDARLGPGPNPSVDPIVYLEQTSMWTNIPNSSDNSSHQYRDGVYTGRDVTFYERQIGCNYGVKTQGMTSSTANRADGNLNSIHNNYTANSSNQFPNSYSFNNESKTSQRKSDAGIISKPQDFNYSCDLFSLQSPHLATTDSFHYFNGCDNWNGNNSISQCEVKRNKDLVETHRINPVNHQCSQSGYSNISSNGGGLPDGNYAPTTLHCNSDLFFFCQKCNNYSQTASCDICFHNSGNRNFRLSFDSTSSAGYGYGFKSETGEKSVSSFSSSVPSSVSSNSNDSSPNPSPSHRSSHHARSQSVSSSQSSGSSYIQPRKPMACQTKPEGDVRLGDWICEVCEGHNFATKIACFTCHVSRPGFENGIPLHQVDILAVGKLGGVSAGVKPGDWTCPKCKENVFAKRNRCYRCTTARPRKMSV